MQLLYTTMNSQYCAMQTFNLLHPIITTSHYMQTPTSPNLPAPAHINPASPHYFLQPVATPTCHHLSFTNCYILHPHSPCISLKIQSATPPLSQLKQTSSTICNAFARPSRDHSSAINDPATTGDQCVSQWIFPSCLQADFLISKIFLRCSQPLRAWKTQLASALCYTLERLIFTMHPNNDLHHNDQLLQGNFAPVTDECPPHACSLDEHSGPLPSFLEGIYVRNGPNVQYKSSTLASHPFDGDGMLHSVSFRDGKATYCCRYVHTSRFIQERAHGQALYPKIFSCLTIKDSYIATAHTILAMVRHMLGLIDLTKRMGLANTSIVFHNGKLLALGEDDLPYALRIETNGDLVNECGFTFSGKGILPKTMTSHPKIDPVTGEMILLSYNVFSHPYLTFFRMSQDGELSKPVAITLQEPSMVHDFAVTPHYIIFPETQLVVHPLDLLKGGAAISCDTCKVQRFGVLPRDATDDLELRWFDVPGCNCFHIINAWEEELDLEEEDGQQHIARDVKEIVLVLPNLASPEDLISGKFDNMKSTLTEVRIDLAEGGRATHRVMQIGAKGDEINNNNHMNVEMGTMNEKYRGVKNRYVYMGVSGSSGAANALSGLVKVDIKSNEVVACRRFDDDYYASEPVFVPSLPVIAPTADAKEDEGILLCMLHHDSARRPQAPCQAAGGGINSADNVIDQLGVNADAECRMLVMNAQSATLDIIASVKLPRRVPYGFHGLFIPSN